VVRDQDQIAGRPQGVHATTRVGNQQNIGAQGAHDPHGESDLVESVPLITVEPPLHGHDSPSGQPTEQETPSVRFNGRCREAGNGIVRHGGLDLDDLGQAAQTGPQDDTDVWRECRVPTDGRDRVIDTLYEVGVRHACRSSGASASGRGVAEI